MSVLALNEGLRLCICMGRVRTVKRIMSNTVFTRQNIFRSMYTFDFYGKLNKPYHMNI